MDYSQIIIGILSGGVIVALLQHFLDKNKQRELEWREMKIKFYVDFMESLSGITDCEKSLSNDIVFAKCCNNLYLFSPSRVVQLLQKFQDEIGITNNNKSFEKYTTTLTDLICEIRKDIKVKNNQLIDVKVLLWTSGTKI